MHTDIAPATPKRHTLNIRIREEEKGLIDQAASMLGKTRTEFILQAARKEAEEALLDRTLIQVSPEAYAAFVERLDAVPQTNRRLIKSLQSAAPWEQE